MRRDIDLMEFATLLRKDDRCPLLEFVRSSPPVLADSDRRLWFVTSYELCAQLLRDPSLSSDTRNAAVVDGGTEISDAFGGSELPIRPYLFFDPPPFALGRPFLFTDPPDHSRLRRLVAKAFTPNRVEQLRPRAEQLAGELLDRRSEPFDLVDGFAYPLPLRIIMELLGVDDDHYQFLRQWGAKLAEALD